jgi:hypothetical protein
MANEDKVFYDAQDLIDMLQISRGHSYKIIKAMNETLKEQGYLVIAGKIPVAYFNEKWYGGGTKKGVT